MKAFLISFCNNFELMSEETHTGLLGILIVDGLQTSFKNLKLPLPNNVKITGATGLTTNFDNYFVIAQSKHSQLLILDKSFSLVEIHSLEPLKGVHSIRHENNSLYMVATKQDKIVKYNLVKPAAFETIFDLNTLKDTHHLNSICHHQGKWLASGFGNHNKEFWMHAENGYVFDVFNQNKILTNLKQPHSLFSWNNQIYVCDSSRQRVIDEDLNVVYQSKTGYIRGLWLDESITLIGHSKGRVNSHSKGTFIGNIANKGILSGECGVMVIQNGNHSFIDLSKHANEIYDIIPLMDTLPDFSSLKTCNKN